jgi:hypothetical protein
VVKVERKMPPSTETIMPGKSKVPNECDAMAVACAHATLEFISENSDMTALGCVDANLEGCYR